MLFKDFYKDVMLSAATGSCDDDYELKMVEGKLRKVKKVKEKQEVSNEV